MSLYEGSKPRTPVPIQCGSVTISLEEFGLIRNANEKFYELIGYSYEDVNTIFQNNIQNIFWESDRKKIDEYYNQVNKNQIVELDLRIRKKDQSMVWLFLFGCVVDFEDGTKAIHNMIFDMTPVKLAEEKMKQENPVMLNIVNEIKETKNALNIEKERFKILLNLNSNTIFEYDMQKDIITFSNNNEISNLKGKIISNFKEILQQFAKIHIDDRERCISFLEGKVNENTEFRYYDEKGNWKWYQVKGVIANNVDHTPETIIGCIYNINEQKKENERLTNQSRLDPLTQLYNNTYTQKMIEDYLAMEGTNGAHSFLIIDIDNFTSVNDHLGHFFADTVLTNIAEQLKKIFKNTDIVGRIGGDEFLVLIKNESNRKFLVEKAKEICNVCLNTYTGENMQYKISCSIGLTLYPQDGIDYLTLFRNADLALYQAKNMAKNSYQFFEVNNMYLLENSEYFNDYDIEPMCEYTVSNFDKEITNFAFDIMAKTKDVNSAIYLLLDRVAKHFDVSHAWIMEKKVDDTSLDITYLWSNNSNLLDKDKYGSLINLTLEDYTDIFDENGIFNISDGTLCKDQLEKYKLTGVDARALLECGIFEDDLFKGCVCIDDCSKTRRWSGYEVDSLVTITKIISSYLLKMRASERTQKRLDKMKNYDALTGLPTLHKFKKEVKEILIHNPIKQYAIVYTDICNFKYVNDTLGFEEGDKILCEYAKLITSDIIKCESVCRISSDKFVLLMEYSNAEFLKTQVISMSEQFNAEQKAKNLNLNLAIISGICIIDIDYVDVMTIIDNANTARKSIRTSLKSVSKYYDPSMQEKIKREMEIENSMEKALSNHEFVAYLQPKIGLKDNRLVGAEALVRWKKEDNSLVQPNDFIPIFEKNGFVVNLDFYIYEEVCKLLRSWLDKEIKAIPISVNVSRVHLNDDKFVTNFKALVDKYKIPTELLELELTESIFLDNTETAIATMKELRNLGFGVSIDDFGAGFSSLNLLKDMNTDVLKLDKEFFRQGEMQKEDQIIVSSIINMAKQLNMKVLSEGVETQMQSDFLKGVSCDMAQGYLYARPMPILAFEKLMSVEISNMINGNETF